MGRQSKDSGGKKGEPDTRALVPLKEVSMLAEDYCDASSPIVRYGLSQELKSRKEKAEGLGFTQIQYVNMLGAGLTPSEACSILGIERALPMLWEEDAGSDGALVYCLRMVKKIEADDVESIIWRRAKTEKNATLDRFMAIKARKPEYRDNYMPGVALQTNIHISLGGKDLDTSINYVSSGEEVIEINAGEVQGNGEAT
jgi:hypothetical protein